MRRIYRLHDALAADEDAIFLIECPTWEDSCRRSKHSLIFGYSIFTLVSSFEFSYGPVLHARVGFSPAVIRRLFCRVGFMPLFVMTLESRRPVMPLNIKSGAFSYQKSPKQK